MRNYVCENTVMKIKYKRSGSIYATLWEEHVYARRHGRVFDTRTFKIKIQRPAWLMLLRKANLLKRKSMKSTAKIKSRNLSEGRFVYVLMLRNLYVVLRWNEIMKDCFQPKQNTLQFFHESIIYIHKLHIHFFYILIKIFVQIIIVYFCGA